MLYLVNLNTFNLHFHPYTKLIQYYVRVPGMNVQNIGAISWQFSSPSVLSSFLSTLPPFTLISWEWHVRMVTYPAI